MFKVYRTGGTIHVHPECVFKILCTCISGLGGRMFTKTEEIEKEDQSSDTCPNLCIQRLGFEPANIVPVGGGGGGSEHRGNCIYV